MQRPLKMLSRILKCRGPHDKGIPISINSLLYSIVVISFAVFGFTGCASGTKQVRPTTISKDIRKIVVLPFYNISGRSDAGRIVTNAFVTGLFKDGRFQVEEPGNIVWFIIQERVSTIGEMEVERLRILGKRLGADAVIVGTVEEFDEGIKGASSVPVVSISARMIDPETGHIIWSAHTRKRGDDYIIAFKFGMIRSVTALSQKVVMEMINTIQ